MNYFTFIKNDVNKTTNILNRCWHCGEENTITVDKGDYIRWCAGLFIQEAFPYLDADQRELIKTGFHPQCWEDAFA